MRYLFKYNVLYGKQVQQRVAVEPGNAQVSSDAATLLRCNAARRYRLQQLQV